MNKWQVTTDPLMLRRMGKTGEELGELQNVVSRIIIQGIDEIDPGTGKTNRQRLIDETADVLAQCYVNMAALGLPESEINARVDTKVGLMAEWESLYTKEDEPGHIEPCRKLEWSDERR